MKSMPTLSYGLHSYRSRLTDSDAEPYFQAGGHPYQFSTEFNIATESEEPGVNFNEGEWYGSGSEPTHDPKELTSELPPGLVANPQGVPHCSLARFYNSECPNSTIIGTVGFRAFAWFQSGYRSIVPLYNLQPQGAYPGELGYRVAGFNFLIHAGVRSGSGYGISASASGIVAIGINRIRVTIWGVPAEHSHDALRGKQCGTTTAFWGDDFVQSPEGNERECGRNHEHLGPVPLRL